MKSFLQKQQELAKLKTKLAKAKLVILSSFARAGEKGLDVKAMRELKRGLKSVDSEYIISKKTIFDRALKKFPISNFQFPINIFNLEGSMGVALGYEDEQQAAKTIYNFARKNPALKYFGAIRGDKFLDFAQFTEFAKLPTKEVMIAKLLGMMKYPITSLAATLKQVVDKK